MKKFNSLVFIDDDHPTNVFHKIVVDESGLCETSRFFSSPIDALNYFKEIHTQQDQVLPDAIFLDINMPEINGWEFIQKYKELGIQHSPVVIMLTTSLFPSDLEKAEQIDIVHKLINKPLDFSHLACLKDELLKDSTLTKVTINAEE